MRSPRSARAARIALALALAMALAAPGLARQAQFIDLGALAQVPGVAFESRAFDVSADGSRVGGRDRDPALPGNQAFT